MNTIKIHNMNAWKCCSKTHYFVQIIYTTFLKSCYSVRNLSLIRVILHI